MPDPREDFNQDGIEYKAATYDHDSAIVYDPTKVGNSEQVGFAVTLISDGTVSLTGDGEQVEGKLIHVEPGGKCVVQYHGTMRLPGGSGATLTRGNKIVGALGPGSAEGYIKIATTQHTISRGEIIDARVPAEVLVRLP